MEGFVCAVRIDVDFYIFFVQSGCGMVIWMREVSHQKTKNKYTEGIDSVSQVRFSGLRPRWPLPFHSLFVHVIVFVWTNSMPGSCSSSSNFSISCGCRTMISTFSSLHYPTPASTHLIHPITLPPLWVRAHPSLSNLHSVFSFPTVSPFSLSRQFLAAVRSVRMCIRIYRLQRVQSYGASRERSCGTYHLHSVRIYFFVSVFHNQDRKPETETKKKQVKWRFIRSILTIIHTILRSIRTPSQRKRIPRSTEPTSALGSFLLK